MDAASFAQHKGKTGRRLVSVNPLDPDALRRFAQAIMDSDPLYVDRVYAKGTRYGEMVAPPLYPAHAFRPPVGVDFLDVLREDPDADGSYGNDGLLFGLEPIPSPFKRLLNGGNEIEFFRCLAVGEKAVANARYADVQLKEGKSGAMLLVVVETTFTTEAGEKLLVNRQTLIWR